MLGHPSDQMDTIVDPSEARRSSARIKVPALDAPRHKQTSIEDAEVEWFARTGLPVIAPPPSRPEPPRSHPRLAAVSEVEIADEDVDIVLDSLDDETECDTLVLATRRFVRARIWQSED